MKVNKRRKPTSNVRTAEAILIGFLNKHKWTYIAAALLIIASNYSQMLVPKVIGTFFDQLVEGLLTTAEPLYYAGLVGGFTLLYLFLSWAANALVYRRARQFEFYLRNILFAHWEKLSANYFTHHSVGDLMAHATNDVHGVRMFISTGLLNVVNAVFSIILAVSMMIGTVDMQLALYSLIPMPFLSLIVAYLRPLIRQRSRAVQHSFSLLSERTQESISGIRVVKAYANEEVELGRFRDAAQNVVLRTLQLTLVAALFSPAVQLVGAISFVISLGLGGIRVINGDLTLGSLIAFNSYLVLLINPMQRIAQVIDQSQRAGAALGRLTDLLIVKSEIKDSPHPVPVERLHGDIEIKGLTFSYPGTAKAALSDFNVQIKAGQTVGILGHTGAGKSTLANLLLRIYDPPRGSIFIDGHDILDLPLFTLRQQIAYVQQDIFLFSDTIRENIAFGVDRPSEEEIVQAARQAQFYDNIMDFPKRFETEIGERGVTLSGGQKQRLALARALIKAAPIMILDDSFSAVDTETEAAILKALQKQLGRQTTIIIAHRISTIKEADFIIVMDEGRIVQQGRHEELISVPGTYRDIYEMQLYGTGETNRPELISGGETAS